MNKTPVYRVVSTFRAAGKYGYRTLPQAECRHVNYMADKGACPCGDPECDNAKESPTRFEKRVRTNQLLPVHGIPMRARDTLLAQMIRSTKCLASWEAMREVINASDDEVAAIHHVKASRFPDCPKAMRRGMKKKRGAVDNSPRPIRSEVEMVLGLDNLKGRLLSVEIECYLPESSRLHRSKNGKEKLLWVGSDASLGSGGIEIRKMTFSKTTEGRMSGLLSLKKDLKGATVDGKCGLHVHVDVRHLPEAHNHRTLCSPDETYDRLTETYPALKYLVPESRWTNRYCAWVNNRSGSKNYSQPENGSRYAAINFDSFNKYHTIEFRLAPGSTNIEKIESWALLCQHLTEWCSKKGNVIPNSFEKLMIILPDWLATWCILRRNKLHSDMKAAIDARILSACDMEDGLAVV